MDDEERNELYYKAVHDGIYDAIIQIAKSDNKLAEVYREKLLGGVCNAVREGVCNAILRIWKSNSYTGRANIILKKVCEAIKDGTKEAMKNIHN